MALSAVSPRSAGGHGLPTVVAARDVAAGSVIAPADVEVVDRPSGQRPGSALASADIVVGRTAAGPIEANEVVTASRLLGADLLSGQPAGHVALTIPVADPASTGARPGARVDVYATGSGDRAATDVVVLAVHEPAESSASSGFGVATPPQVTLSLAADDAARVARSLSALDAAQSFVLAIRPLATVPQ